MRWSGGRIPLCVRNSSCNSLSVAFHGIARFATSQEFSGNGFLELLLDQLLEPLEIWPVSSCSLPIFGSNGQHAGPIADDSIGF